jgi:UDP-3-O-[3-hydroxymyristoyl] glucosamine N-acyltransferase
MIENKYTLREIADRIGARLVGNDSRVVTAIAPIQTASEEAITFHIDQRYNHFLSATKAVVIIHETALPLCHTDALVCESPYLAYAIVARMFSAVANRSAMIDKSAVVHSSAWVHPSCHVAANVVIGENVKIAEGSVIEAGCVIGDNCKIGKACHFMANVTLYHDCVIHDHVLVHSGTVIGSDGFGHAQDKNNHWIAIPQLGGVLIEDHVEIGANCTIDRGSFMDTVIGSGVVIDNLVQIAHNVKIGKHTAIAACVGISGSVEIGSYCRIAGQVGIAGHLRITDHVTLMAKSQVTKSLLKPGVYSSIIGCQERSVWNKNSARLRHLDRLMRRLLHKENM